MVVDPVHSSRGDAAASEEQPARHVIAHVTPSRTTTVGGAGAWLWIGDDERGRELEIIGNTIEPSAGPAFLHVIHVMPSQLRG